MTLDQVIKLLNSFSILVGIGVAIFGFWKWRAELFARRRIELCEDILTRLYEVRDAIIGIRNPLVFSGEGSSRAQIEGETPQERQRREQAYVYYERFENRREPFDALNKLKYRFMAIYGVEWAGPFQTFVAVVNKIMVTAGFAFRDTEDGEYYGESHQKSAAAKRARHDAVLYRIEGQPDEIDRDIAIAIEQLESKCRSEIKSESSLWYGLTQSIRRIINS